MGSIPGLEHGACPAAAHGVLEANTMMTEVLGWLSSFVLVLTIGRQVHRQWRSGHSEGVSIWLFVGQMVASTGFTIYSALVHNWVFVVTNAMMLVFAVAGFLIEKSHRSKAPRQNASSSTLRADRGLRPAAARRSVGMLVRDPERTASLIGDDRRGSAPS